MSRLRESSWASVPIHLRALGLIGSEVIANAAIWTAAGVCFGKEDEILGLALLAWASDGNRSQTWS
ncbi:hypothetical protein BD324DRAFT_648372 [Kockovaella imperatae]|uniref:Uncharacterized protein n=1 Tax=Kockovaella imperatae TaxID=4999 RepID=A0A1Y1UP20_9TREE|nr:hypothetical protein BD324DRAFT_648372 [Kockovaella imperatae]ORX39742.1 hypothetical protein BD324DRAFT_648372 [Kockovaella imperatae]